MNVLGQGIYSHQEAARLIGVPSRRLRGWFFGRTKGAGKLLVSDYQGSQVSFLDLIDAAVVAALREKVSVQALRRVYRRLSEMWQTAHPFSRQEFYTDKSGRRVFVTIVRDQDQDSEFIEVIERQHAMPEVLMPILTKIHYDPDTMFAQKLPLTEGVSIDPRRRYGKPIVESCGLATEIINETFLSNGRDIDRVADWLGINPSEVVHAVQFEEAFSGIAA